MQSKNKHKRHHIVSEQTYSDGASNVSWLLPVVDPPSNYHDEHSDVPRDCSKEKPNYEPSTRSNTKLTSKILVWIVLLGHCWKQRGTYRNHPRPIPQQGRRRCRTCTGLPSAIPCTENREQQDTLKHKNRWRGTDPCSCFRLEQEEKRMRHDTTTYFTYYITQTKNN